MSIRAQILIAVACICIATVTGFGWLVTQRVQARANQLAHEAALETAQFVALIGTHGIDKTGASFNGVVKRLDETGWLIKLGSGETTRIQLYDVRGVQRFDSSRPDAALTGGPDVEAALKGTPLLEPVLLPDRRVAAAQPLRRGVDGEILGAVRVIRPVVGVAEILGSLAPEIATLALVAVLLAVVSAFVVGRSITAPISRLTEAAMRIAAGDRSHPLPVPRGAEVRSLTRAYLEMRRELEDKREIERLSQDLSHELKNPIASVRALSEALEAGALSDPVTGPRMVAQVHDASKRMEEILVDMLALARLESRGLDRREPLDLLELVAEALRPIGGKVEVTPAVLPLIRGDRVWLTRAVGNLLRNAVENAGGEAVRVDASVTGTQLELRIANPGAVPEAIRDRLFERFVTRRPEGTGLGMAIARSVAEAHGGSVAVVEAGPPRVVLALRLPV
jgi:signal transduction histidine kinase